MGMIPGFDANLLGSNNDKSSQIQIKRYITIIESMSEKELDCTNIKTLSEPSRLARLARGAGEKMGSLGVVWVLLLSLHFMICHSNNCHRPRSSSCHEEQRGGCSYAELAHRLMIRLCDMP